MATASHNLSQNDNIPSAEGMKFGIIAAEWNSEVTDALLDGAVKTLKEAGCLDMDIIIKRVPGTFELPFAAQLFAQCSDVDAIIILGCVIQGETRHFDYVCSGVTQGAMQVSLEWSVPVAFGVLTVDNQQQALDRAGGKHGNKGDEAAATAIKMAYLQNSMFEEGEIEVPTTSKPFI